MTITRNRIRRDISERSAVKSVRSVPTTETTTKNIVTTKIALAITLVKRRKTGRNLSAENGKGQTLETIIIFLLQQSIKLLKISVRR